MPPKKYLEVNMLLSNLQAREIQKYFKAINGNENTTKRKVCRICLEQYLMKMNRFKYFY